MNPALPWCYACFSQCDEPDCEHFQKCFEAESRSKHDPIIEKVQVPYNGGEA